MTAYLLIGKSKNHIEEAGIRLIFIFVKLQTICLLLTKLYVGNMIRSAWPGLTQAQSVTVYKIVKAANWKSKGTVVHTTFKPSKVRAL